MMDTAFASDDAYGNDVLDKINKNIYRYYNFNSRNIERSREDNHFLFYDMWTPGERSEFMRLQKPMFTYNKLYEYYIKAVGEQRYNSPDLTIRSINGEASQDDITLRADIVRGIQYESKADIVFQTAFEQMFAGGMGAARVKVDFESPQSFNQKIMLDTLKYPERVFYDTLAKKTDKSDGQYIGVYDTMSRTVFCEQYPDIQYPQSFPAKYDTREFKWGDKDSITIVEYYQKEYYSYYIYQLDDGSVVSDKDYRKMKRLAKMAVMPVSANDEAANDESENESDDDSSLNIPAIVARRKTRDYKIMMYKAIWGKIIEKQEWPCREFPIIMFLGPSVQIDGEEYIISGTRYAKDPQRFINFIASDLAQAVKNNRREQFLATASNVAGNELIWKNPANQVGALLYTPDELTQQPPIRLPVSEIPQTLLQNLQQASLDLQSILGFYEANKGADGQEVSGVALDRRQKSGNMGLAAFFDNLNRGIEQIGRVILSLLPRIYDTERSVPAQTIDGKSKYVVVNKKVAGGVHNDLSNDNFDISITAGPNFAVQRAQALEVLVQICQLSPNIFPLIADIMGENIDIEKQAMLVSRLKTLVPQQVIAQEEGRPAPQPQPDPQMQLMQAKLQNEQQGIQLKSQKQQMDHQLGLLQFQIDQKKLQLQAIETQLESQSSIARAQAEVAKAHMGYEADAIDHTANLVTTMHKTAQKHLDVLKQASKPETTNPDNNSQN